MDEKYPKKPSSMDYSPLPAEPVADAAKNPDYFQASIVRESLAKVEYMNPFQPFIDLLKAVEPGVTITISRDHPPS